MALCYRPRRENWPRREPESFRLTRLCNAAPTTGALAEDEACRGVLEALRSFVVLLLLQFGDAGLELDRFDRLALGFEHRSDRGALVGCDLSRTHGLSNQAKCCHDIGSGLDL